MRGLAAVGLLLSLSTPCFANTYLKSEPYYLAPFSVVYVDNGVCGVGKVLKVKGALGALRRQKTCVFAGSERPAPIGINQASLVAATP